MSERWPGGSEAGAGFPTPGERMRTAAEGFDFARSHPGFMAEAVVEFDADKWGGALAHEFIACGRPGALDEAAGERAAQLLFAGGARLMGGGFSRAMEWIQGAAEIAAGVSGSKFEISTSGKPLPEGRRLEPGEAKALFEGLMLRSQTAKAAKGAAKPSPSL